MKTLPFKTRRIASQIDPSGGFSIFLDEQEAVDGVEVFEQVCKEKTLPYDAGTLSDVFAAVVKGATKLVSEDGTPRRLAGCVRVEPRLRGKVASAYSAFNPETCSGVVGIRLLTGAVKALDLEKLALRNVQKGNRVVVSHISTVGGTEDFALVKGQEFEALGENLTFLAGDTVTASWVDEGETRTVALTPVAASSGAYTMRFAWPAALSDLADGTEVKLVFTLRGGIVDAAPQTVCKPVTLVAAA